MLRLEQCALCGDRTKLELSHIVPKFVIRTLKKTAVGQIRSTENPNIPIQDSEKHYMLCGDCEDLFCSSETIFANKIFHPYIKKEKDIFKYEDWLNYCLTSISWRSLFLDLIDFAQSGVINRLETFQCLVNSECIMKDYLLGNRSDIGSIENHLFFFDYIGEMSKNYADIVKGLRPHTTIHRGISSYSFAYEEVGTYGTITNMMGIVLVTFYQKGKEEVWENTLITNTEGTIQARDQYLQSSVGNDLTHIMKETQRSGDKLSKKQRQKIHDRIKDVGDKIDEYDIYKDMIHDTRLNRS